MKSCRASMVAMAVLQALLMATAETADATSERIEAESTLSSSEFWQMINEAAEPVWPYELVDVRADVEQESSQE